jgi:hypothetical protein
VLDFIGIFALFGLTLDARLRYSGGSCCFVVFCGWLSLSRDFSVGAGCEGALWRAGAPPRGAAVGAARVLVSPELRAAAGLTRDVLLLGMGHHLELWAADRHAASEAALLQQPMPEVLRNFTF